MPNSHLTPKSTIIITISLAFLFSTSCDNHISGPSIPESKQLSVFCILNPAAPVQTLNLQRSLAFGEIKAGLTPDLNISDADIELSRQEHVWQPLQMLPETRPAVIKATHFGLDDIFGTGNFNYLFNDLSLEPNQRYRLRIHSEEYGTITAETEIPGPFEVTEIIEFKRSWLNPDSSKPARVTWSTSAGAAGYLIDLTVLVYHYMPWWPSPEQKLTEGDTIPVLPALLREDSTYFINNPWQEIPVNLNASTNSFQRGFLTQANQFEITGPDLLERAE
ncbi:DUF4249 family protein, partial [candidate division KSB1 bacterium]|nr:DUF4249 family protein [candidate division KSB1 bacterium]